MTERRPITAAEVMAGRNHPPDSPTPGAWTRDRLEEWGVPWPPPAFWIRHLIQHGVPYKVVDDGSDDYQVSPYMSETTKRRMKERR